VEQLIEALQVDNRFDTRFIAHRRCCGKKLPRPVQGSIDERTLPVEELVWIRIGPSRTSSRSGLRPERRSSGGICGSGDTQVAGAADKEGNGWVACYETPHFIFR